jgi:hypothetical protein
MKNYLFVLLFVCVLITGCGKIRHSKRHVRPSHPQIRHRRRSVRPSHRHSSRSRYTARCPSHSRSRK